MNKGVRNTIISCVAFIALVMGLTLNRILSPAAMTNEELSENGLFVYDVPRRINDFSLVDYNDAPVDLSLLQGKWSLIFFGYTYCPDICPLTMATLNQFSQILEAEGDYMDDTQVIMVSVDPQRDTPEKLREYVGYFNDDYLGLSGEYIDLFNFASQLNIAFAYVPGNGENYLVNHSGEIALINPNGHFHGFFKMPHNPESMATNYEVIRARWQ
ncbi:MAG: SCO family protein [Gammaproteobacteria bacterium]|nr:SCO family protein [Gammaproteobacteria bacterium]MAY02953.1 SCO family protein [Gammaproteobacteria bacterium]|tara:strand:- start:162 stop:803 length:642 start_codon:yes stop_codon:yes gene_type:complete